MNHIVVIGAAGNIGRVVVSQLATRGAHVRALVRRPDAAGFPAEVELARGDLTAPETLDVALEGMDAVFLVWTAPAAAFAPAFERIAKYARRIVFLSAPLKTPHPFFQQPNPMRALVEQTPPAPLFHRHLQTVPSGGSAAGPGQDLRGLRKGSTRLSRMTLCQSAASRRLSQGSICTNPFWTSWTRRPTAPELTLMPGRRSALPHW